MQQLLLLGIVHQQLHAGRDAVGSGLVARDQELRSQRDHLRHAERRSGIIPRLHQFAEQVVARRRPARLELAAHELLKLLHQPRALDEAFVADHHAQRLHRGIRPVFDLARQGAIDAQHVGDDGNGKWESPARQRHRTRRCL